MNPMLLISAVALTASHLPSKKVVGYVPTWIDLTKLPATVDFSKLTHVNLAFENPVDDSGTLSLSPQTDPFVAKVRKRSIKILVSIGGGSAAEDEKVRSIYDRLLMDENRPGFVRKLVDFVQDHKLDGIDVDLEGPAITRAYGPFIADLAKAMHSRGKLLTAALSKGYGGGSVPDAALNSFDFVNVMAYDETGPWSKDRPGQHSSFQCAVDNLEYWTKRGLPKSKFVLGVPFYGYGFGEAYRNDDYAYSELLSLFPQAADQDKVGNTIWHNSRPTIRAKAKYIVDQGLGGAMIWSVDQDTSGEKSLLNLLWNELQQPKRAG